MTIIAGPHGSRLKHRLIPVGIGLWNVLGVLGFTMVASRNPDVLAHVAPPVIDWLDSTPTWALLPWMLAVGGGFVGALLLLERSCMAIAAFAASLAGLAILQVWLVCADLPASMFSPVVLAAALLSWGSALAQLRYAWSQWRAGMLR